MTRLNSPSPTLKTFTATRVALSAAKYLCGTEIKSSIMPKAATGFYAVCKGHEIGVFTTWYVLLADLSHHVCDRVRSVPATTVRYEAFWNCG